MGRNVGHTLILAGTEGKKPGGILQQAKQPELHQGDIVIPGHAQGSKQLLGADGGAVEVQIHQLEEQPPFRILILRGKGRFTAAGVLLGEKYGRTLLAKQPLAKLGLGNFTGLNAAVLAEGGEISIADSQIISHAIGGNNVFAHGAGSHITLNNVLLDAYGAASNRCIYVSFGGQVDADHCEMTSRGSISSPVATDVGGGTIRLKNCVVKALGNHCAALYSTGRIEAEHCVCVAPETEGMIIVGSNSISLRDSHVFSGQNQGIKFASELGESQGVFTMEGGSLTAAEGPLFQVELDARIVLKHTAIAVPSGQLLKLYRGFSPPGMEQPEPGQSLIQMELEQQQLTGTMGSDAMHTLELHLSHDSLFTGSITAPDSTITLSRDSRWILTGDSAIGTLLNDDPTGENVILNGFALKCVH